MNREEFEKAQSIIEDLQYKLDCEVDAVETADLLGSYNDG